LELLLGLLFGIIGSAYLIYGKRSYEPWYIVTGFALIIYPYFVSGPLVTLLVGVALGIVPIARDRGWI
jgi:hypothetical protein